MPATAFPRLDRQQRIAASLGLSGALGDAAVANGTANASRAALDANSRITDDSPCLIMRKRETIETGISGSSTFSRCKKISAPSCTHDRVPVTNAVSACTGSHTRRLLHG